MSSADTSSVSPTPQGAEGDPTVPSVLPKGTASRGGTLTFTNIGAAGFWGRRLDKTGPDAACDIDSRTIDLGAAGGTTYCCRTKHLVTTDTLTPFDAQMTLIMRGPMQVGEIAVYQPESGQAFWKRASHFVQASSSYDNIKISKGDGTQKFPGTFGDACEWYAMLPAPFPCGPGSDPYCPADGPDVHNRGWEGSKLVILRAAMPHTKALAANVSACSSGTSRDAPWIGFSASELLRDGWGKYFPCHCYDNTDGSVGAGCGEINVFETISEEENTSYGNANILSTGIRSYQVGSLAGHTCGIDDCVLTQVDATIDLVDGCKKAPLSGGAVQQAGGATASCPVWQRPTSERFFYILLDVSRRLIQVGILHPEAVPSDLAPLLPALPDRVAAQTITTMGDLRLPTSP